MAARTLTLHHVTTSSIGKTSSFVGPFVPSAIVDDPGNNSSPFYILFALSLASTVFLLLTVDLRK